MSELTPTPPSIRSAARRIAVLTVVHAALIGTLLLMFAWPGATAEPRDVPIGIVAPAPVADLVRDRVATQQEGAVDLISYDSAADAEAAIADRAIYGAIVLGPAPEALVASAASPAVAQLITDLTRSISDALAAQSGTPGIPLTVSDVAGFAEADLRGAVFGSFALPLVIGGISLAALAALRLTSRRSRALLVGIGSVTTGLTLTAIATGWLEALPGSFGSTWLAISAILAAISFSLIGAHSLFGVPGLGAVAAVLFLLGNPLNGVALPPEFYLDGWGTVGQLMPIGAGFDILRTVNFFPAASATDSWWVLAVWITVGVIALAFGSLRRRQASPTNPATA